MRQKWLISNCLFTNNSFKLECFKELYFYSNFDINFKCGKFELCDKVFLKIDKHFILERHLYSHDEVFVYKKNKTFFISNDLDFLFRLTQIKRALNIKKCIDFLTSYSVVYDSDPTKNKSFFNDVFLLPENGCILFNHMKLKYKQNRKIRIQYNSNSKNFRDIIISNIKSKNFGQKIGVEISGGIDSACILECLISSGFDPKNIYAFILGYKSDDLVQVNDAQIAINLCTHFKVNYTVFYGEDIERAWDYSLESISNGPLIYASPTFIYKVKEFCARNGIEHVFTGDGGDELLSGSKYIIYSKDLIHFKSTYNQISEISKNVLHDKIRNVIKELIIEPIIFGNLFYIKKNWKDCIKTVPDYFTKKIKFKNLRYNLKLKRNLNKSGQLKEWNRRFIYDFGGEGPRCFSYKYEGIEFEYPFYNEEILFKAISVKPSELYNFQSKNDYANSKSVLRKEFKDKVPHFILERQTKTTYNQANKMMFMKQFPKLYNYFSQNDMFLDKHHIIDKNAFLKEFLRYYLVSESSDVYVSSDILFLESICDLEMWILDLKRRGVEV